MTDIEREMRFERKKQEIIEQLLGAGTVKPSKRFAKSSQWKKRQEKANCDAAAFDPWLSQYNNEFRKNHGRVVTIDTTPLETEVGAPVK